MATSLSEGGLFPNTLDGSQPAPHLYVAHGLRDKSGGTLLTENSRVLLHLGNGTARLLTYDTVRSLRDHLDTLLIEYDDHQNETATHREEQNYKARLDVWKQTLRENSVNTYMAIAALFDGQSVAAVDDVLEDATGKDYEVFKLNPDWQVMSTTGSNPKPCATSNGPLSCLSKYKQWVVCPFQERPTRG